MGTTEHTNNKSFGSANSTASTALRFLGSSSTYLKYASGAPRSRCLVSAADFADPNGLFGAAGSILTLTGTENTPSGGNSTLPQMLMDPGLTPTKVDRPAEQTPWMLWQTKTRQQEPQKWPVSSANPTSSTSPNQFGVTFFGFIGIRFECNDTNRFKFSSTNCPNWFYVRSFANWNNWHYDIHVSPS